MEKRKDDLKRTIRDAVKKEDARSRSQAAREGIDPKRKEKLKAEAERISILAQEQGVD